jgi:deoxyribodipyrimidine photo-lyase
MAHPYRVFTPCRRAWRAAGWRPLERAPGRVTLPERLPPGVTLETVIRETVTLETTNSAAAEGEAAGRRRLGMWVRRAGRYAGGRDLLAADDTSRLSPHLHFGCLSPREVAERVDDEAYRRQLCWRDFYQQVLFTAPDLPTRPLRPDVVEKWREDADALDAWRAGRTGVPIVDAAMRQLAAEGWMHNRGRLITAAFLARHLGLDWRAGAAHYADLLLDADVASNNGNWQWVAGTGTDTRPYRRFNRSDRPSASTRATTSGATSPSWRASRAARCASPGASPRRCGASSAIPTRSTASSRRPGWTPAPRRRAG